MITFKHEGNFDNTEKFFREVRASNYKSILEKYAREGIALLAAATPVNSGQTAASWGYKITDTKTGIKITWTNSNVVDGVPIAVLIQYGHATRDGGHVEGRDFINPVMQPLFEKIQNELWGEVTVK